MDAGVTIRSADDCGVAETVGRGEVTTEGLSDGDDDEMIAGGALLEAPGVVVSGATGGVGADGGTDDERDRSRFAGIAANE